MTTDTPPNIEVFQDLTLWLGQHTSNDVRDALAAQAAAPWRHAPEREQQEAHQDEGEYFAFERQKQDDLPKIGLVLWKERNELRVTNLVPITSGQLSIQQYNRALTEFKTLIADPVASHLGLKIVLTKQWETLTDWMSSGTADLLRRFSAMANKSTGSSHPSDRARWFAFIIAAHKEQVQATDRIKQWLIDVEHWHPERAVDLIIEYEYGLELLLQYEQQRY
ncbi:MAG: hypothetical protein R3F04_02975 [Lysobacteraceae bacterium]